MIQDADAGRDEVALRKPCEIVGEAPDFSEAWFSIARLEHRNGRISETCVSLERVVELDPGRGEAWNLLAVSELAGPG